MSNLLGIEQLLHFKLFELWASFLASRAGLLSCVIFRIFVLPQLKDMKCPCRMSMATLPYKSGYILNPNF